MNSYTEEDIINSFINNIKIGDDYKVTTHELHGFFHYVIKEVPDKYKNIKRELSFIRANYKSSIKWSTDLYYSYIVAVFTEIHNRGIKLPRELFAYIRNHKYNFSMVHDLMDYFVTIFLPDRLDLVEINNIKIDSISRFYQRVGFNVILTAKAGFSNPNEQELFDIINFFEYHGVYSLRAVLIGFYYINHNNYDLNIEMLTESLYDLYDLYDKMELNDLVFTDLSDKILINIFRNKEKKKIIK